MIDPSVITDSTRRYITDKLTDLAKQHNIQIMTAVESGSRAWGFPSRNSDYDVRFLYLRPAQDYVSVADFRDVIETPLTDDPILHVPLDLNGWDIRKALQLGLKSNAILNEWLSSPICYIDQRQMSDLLRQFLKNTADLTKISYHYDRLARNSWQQITENQGDIKLKLYCYLLRPVLTLDWIRHFAELPPMDLYHLCHRLPLGTELTAIISQLVAQKAIAQEHDLISRNTHLDQYIMSILETKIEKPSDIGELNMSHLKAADQLFRQMIGMDHF